MSAETIWGYRAGYLIRLADLERVYGFESGAMLGLNPHLRDVCLAQAGDLLFLPISAESAEELPDLFPLVPPYLLEDIEQISPYEAALVTAGARARAGNNSNNFISLDAGLLQTIMNRCAGTRIRSKLDLGAVADTLNRALTLAEATTRRREVAFLSQAVIETDFFRTYEEYGKGGGHAYGNYFGRGLLQLTWKDTYAACSQKLYKDDRLVQHPEQVASDSTVNVQASAWYWRDYKSFNTLADQENVDEIIHKLYGGTSKSSSAAVRHSVELRRGHYVTIQMILNQRHDRRL